MLKLFIDHPATVGETYWAHLLFAGRFGLRMMAGGAACLLHGLLPFLFTSTRQPDHSRAAGSDATQAARKGK